MRTRVFIEDEEDIRSGGRDYAKEAQRQKEHDDYDTLYEQAERMEQWQEYWEQRNY